MGQNHLKEYVGTSLSKAQQLKYKYILSIEGNDVATNTAWVLASNSAAFMPPPTKEHWFMYGRLKPWVHYIPLYENQTFEEALSPCHKNTSLCADIARNGEEFMLQFVDLEKEEKIAERVVQRWIEKYNNK